MATYSNGTKTASYKYDENGIRTSKTVNGTKTSFFVDGTTILAQKAGNITIPFYYDGNGKRIAFKYGGSMYFYVYNLQGDVTHILDADSNIVGTYIYDAWGKITNLSSLTSIAQTNPFRYRGYYYDTESGLYYLNSRYYNPDWGRFLNADSYVTTGQGLTSYNMFAYCGNNPVNNIDPNGDCPYNGTVADFHRLEQGLPSLDCICEITNGISIGISAFDSIFSASVDASLELVKYANETSVRPNNIGPGAYKKIVAATNDAIAECSSVFNAFSNVLSVGQIVFDAVSGLIYNCSTNASVDVIIWDASIDILYCSAGLISTTVVTTAVGEFVGTLCPIPVVGTIAGAVAGFALGYVIDLCAKEMKAAYRKN